ncbi:MAG: hypothetical protein JNK89_05055, partial [Saprospiraceae bacterium]|nr:hypothetical protein [Saprospiraceae bacterium]
MQKLPFLFLILLTGLGGIVFYYRNQPTAIASPADYSRYLSEKQIESHRATLSARIAFWEKKLRLDPDNFVFQKKLAGLFAQDFRQRGDIAQLRRSDSLWQLVLTRYPDQTDVLLGLAANAITRHAFRDAEKYAAKAYALGEKKFSCSLILADVHLERGNFTEAGFLLENVASTHHFDYLIRKVKLLDQNGNLDEAVVTMEKAAGLAKSSGSDALYNWSLSNLADMYGHQGKIRLSYQTYLKALEYNPADFHALKGIAWIAFVADKNSVEATRIVQFLKS